MLKSIDYEKTNDHVNDDIEKSKDVNFDINIID